MLKFQSILNQFEEPDKQEALNEDRSAKWDVSKVGKVLFCLHPIAYQSAITYGYKEQKPPNTLWTNPVLPERSSFGDR